MADRIVIVGTRRGGSIVPAREIVQMAGRCARKPGEHGIADVISDPSDVDLVTEAMIGGKGLEVASQLVNGDSIAFHLVVEIAAGRVRNNEDALRWWSRSFAAKTNKKHDMDGAWNMLVETGMITSTTDSEATDLGRLSVDLYFHPSDIHAWKLNFSDIFERGLETNDAAVAWAASHTRCGRNRFHTQDHEVLEMFSDQMRSLSLDNEGTVGWGLAWWAALGGYRAKGIGIVVGDLKKDVERYISAFKRLDQICGWGKESFFDSLRVRIKKGIPQELTNLCSISGISKGAAFELSELGVTSSDDISEKWDIISEYGSEQLVRTLLESGFGN